MTCLQDVDYAKKLNVSLAFFIHDAFSLMDRGFVFGLIKTYLKKVSQLYMYMYMYAHGDYLSLSLVYTIGEGLESTRVSSRLSSHCVFT